MELKHTSSARGSIWINCVFCLVPEEADRPRRVLVLLDEISDRKKVEEERKELSNRFIRAQETERTRIARELHDDIGQRLAILRIQMLRAGRAVSDMPDKTHPSIPQLAENVKEIANRITEISHQLHSSHLEYIGLKSAVENACREFEAEYRTRVKYTSERLDAKVDGIIGLCCLRVVQEALHNIGKHSSAKNVEVSLSTSQDHLGLLVTDDGAGFDLEQARFASGLGLISMRERVHMVGGQFEITSVRGTGTRVRASVPLAGPAKSELDGAQ
jgi:signal transduction histidine kinase